MRIFSVSALCAGLCMVSPAYAAGKDELRQKLFAIDKAAAIAGFNVSQKEACIRAFHSRYQSHYVLGNGLAFNEPMSWIVYDRLYWKGNTSSQRGVIFTGTVSDQAGANAGRLMCYYAITDYRLDFQSAYVLPAKVKEAASASRGRIAAETAL